MYVQTDTLEDDILSEKEKDEEGGRNTRTS
jgi:hypothetical protein